MKKIINYVIVVLITIILCLIVFNLNKKNNFEKLYDSTVYIEALNSNQVSMATGIVYKTNSSKAYIITNYHAVNGFYDISVYNKENKGTKAKLYKYDKTNDLAILEISNDLDLKEAKFGNSDKVNIADNIYVLGTPLNKKYINTLSSGIISYINRSIKINNIKYNTIQIDALISGGNSGGPLIDENGKVIGIIFIKENSTEGIGFALPINDVIKNIKKLGI